MGPVKPPQRKGLLPQYAPNKLVELKQKCDELEQLGVFKRPEDVGISVVYLNPSFLVKKGVVTTALSPLYGCGPIQQASHVSYAQRGFYSSPHRLVETHSCNWPQLRLHNVASGFTCVLQWPCPVQKEPWKSSRAASLEISFKKALSLKLQVICTAVAILQLSFYKIGNEFCFSWPTVICVCSHPKHWSNQNPPWS